MTTTTRPPRPTVLPATPSAIPAELRERDHWVTWAFEWSRQRDEWAKVPRRADGKGRASSTDPATWTTFEEAGAVYEGNDDLAGIGYVFADDDPFVGIDLDKCRDAETGKIDPSAMTVIESIDSYTEVSPSGTGVKIIARAKKPGAKCSTKKGIPWRRRGAEGQIEMYESGRFFTLTGETLDGYDSINDAQVAVEQTYGRFFGWPKDADPEPTPKVEKRHPSLISYLGRILGSPGFEQGYDLPDRLLVAAKRYADEHFAEKYTDDQLREQAEDVAGRFNRGEWDASPVAGRASSTDNFSLGDPLPIETYPAIRVGGGANDLSDAGLAREVKNAYGDRIRSVDDEGRNGTPLVRSPDGPWTRSGAMQDVRRATQIAFEQLPARVLDRGADDPVRRETLKFSSSPRAKGLIDNAVAILATDPDVRVKRDDLDTHRTLLAFRDCTVELKSGKAREHRPDELITRYIDLDYDSEATCPKFEDMFAFAYPDEATRAYMRRVIGYGVTGHADEKLLWIALGPTGTLKTTTLKAVGDTMGPLLAAPIKFETLTVGAGQRARGASEATPDLLALDRMRFIYAEEPDDQVRKFNGGLLKRLTGGTAITVRGLYSEPYNMEPHFTAIVAANDPIPLNIADEALRERIVVIPHTNQVPREERDPNFLTRLLAEERQGIAAWLVRCAKEYLDGDPLLVSMPPEVRRATDDYFERQNPLHDFLKTRTTYDPSDVTLTSSPEAFYEAYRAWENEHRAQSAITDDAYREALEVAGIKKERRMVNGVRARFLVGVELLGALEPDNDYDEGGAA